jgi:hypothetical protein
LVSQPVQQTKIAHGLKLVACAGLVIAAATYDVAARYIAVMTLVEVTYGFDTFFFARVAASFIEV